MSVSSEDALRLAVLNHPETFGLTQSEINPLLLFALRCVEQPADQANADEAAQCFVLCQANLYRKVAELRAGFRLVAEATEAESAPIKPQPAARPAAKAEARVDAAANGNGLLPGATATVVSEKLTTKQLRYMGYLYRQLGEEPDYKNDISGLSQVQATMRIKELEKRLGR